LKTDSIGIMWYKNINWSKHNFIIGKCYQWIEQHIALVLHHWLMNKEGDNVRHTVRTEV